MYSKLPKNAEWQQPSAAAASAAFLTTLFWSGKQRPNNDLWLKAVHGSHPPSSCSTDAFGHACVQSNLQETLQIIVKVPVHTSNDGNSWLAANLMFFWWFFWHHNPSKYGASYNPNSPRLPAVMASPSPPPATDNTQMNMQLHFIWDRAPLISQ